MWFDSRIELIKNVDAEDDYATCSLKSTIVQGHQRTKARLTAGFRPEIIMCESVSRHHRVRTEAPNCRPSASSGPLYNRRARSAWNGVRSPYSSGLAYMYPKFRVWSPFYFLFLAVPRMQYTSVPWGRCKDLTEWANRLLHAKATCG